MNYQLRLRFRTHRLGCRESDLLKQTLSALLEVFSTVVAKSRVSRFGLTDAFPC